MKKKDYAFSQVPVEENYRLTLEYRKQLGLDMQK